MNKIVIAQEFTRTPGPRNQDEGDFSGELFLKEKLEPLFLKSRDTGLSLLVDLDGAEGYATSFLEAAFGGLARKYGADVVLKTLSFKSDDEPYLIDEIKDYVQQANA
ncbi:MAG: STAS-like domain-containing protein [Opitutae bacterium]|nr:STAS-like domain-containing protein [Opitutae bacterium]